MRSATTVLHWIQAPVVVRALTAGWDRSVQVSKNFEYFNIVNVKQTTVLNTLVSCNDDSYIKRRKQQKQLLQDTCSCNVSGLMVLLFNKFD